MTPVLPLRKGVEGGLFSFGVAPSWFRSSRNPQFRPRRVVAETEINLGFGADHGDKFVAPACSLAVHACPLFLLFYV
jgi:hypothetical protein